MECPECNNTGVNLLDTDNFECDCGKVIDIAYYACSRCGYTWRYKNGEYLDGCDVGDFVMSDEFNSIIDELLGIDHPDDVVEELSLKSVLHECIRCGKIATETDKNTFVCINCNFEWVVDDFTDK